MMNKIIITALTLSVILTLTVSGAIAQEERITFEERANTWEYNVGSETSMFLIVNEKIQDKGYLQMTESSRNSVPTILNKNISMGTEELLLQFSGRPYLAGEVYTITVTNGDFTTSTSWTPIPALEKAKGGESEYNYKFDADREAKIRDNVDDLNEISETARDWEDNKFGTIFEKENQRMSNNVSTDMEATILALQAQIEQLEERIIALENAPVKCTGWFC